MFDNPVIEVAIALILMFFLAAVIASALVEWLSNLMKKRSKYLLRAVRDLFDECQTPTKAGELTAMATGPGQADQERDLYKKAMTQPTLLTVDAAAPKTKMTVEHVMSHPLIEALKQKQASGMITRLPSYVPSRTFAVAMLDLLDSRSGLNDQKARIEEAIEELPNHTLKSALKALHKHSGGSTDKLEKAIAHWYDDTMDRLSGSYKRWAKRWLIVVGLLIAAVMHLDSLALAQHLWTDAPARAAIVSAAADASACHEKEGTEAIGDCIDDTVASVNKGGFPIGPSGWNDQKFDSGSLFSLVIGILATGLAASLGGPFWFDALRRLNSLRNTGPKPDPA